MLKVWREVMVDLSKWILSGGKDEDEHECKGLVFRCLDTEYSTKRGYARKQEMNFLSRKSCRECCISSLLDELKEFGAIFPEDPKHNGLYYLTTTNHHIDWETGHMDDYDLIFIEIEE
jgi:hypothetical protein